MEAPSGLNKDVSIAFIPSQRPNGDFIRFSPGLMGEVNKHAVGTQGEGVNKFITNDKENKELDYIIWWNTETSISATYTPIPTKEWKALLKDRETFDKTNRVFLNARRDAQNFYPWKVFHKGISIVNAPSFEMEMSGPYGVRVSYATAKRLIESIKSGNEEKIKQNEIHIAASFVHEYVHLEKDDFAGFGGNNRRLEIASHIGQFLYDPQGNFEFKKQIQRTINHFRDGFVVNDTDTYNMGVYTALVLIADKLQKINPLFKEVLYADPNKNKFNSLEKMANLIDSNTRDLLKNTILKESLITSGKNLVKKFDQILSSWTRLE